MVWPKLDRSVGINGLIEDVRPIEAYGTTAFDRYVEIVGFPNEDRIVLKGAWDKETVTSEAFGSLRYS